MRPVLSRLATLAAAAITLASCVTTPPGEAIADRGEVGELAFEGLVGGNDHSEPRYVFITHGMGPTEETFADALLTRLDEAGYRRVPGGPAQRNWIRMQLPQPIWLAGEALDCPDGPDLPPCRYQTFGKFKVDTFAKQGSRIIVYRWFWDEDLRLVQKPYMRNDDAIPRSALATALKQRIINYGFTDASAYLGPLGKVLRASTEGAVCTMIRHSLDGAEPSGLQAPPCRFDSLDPNAKPAARFYFISQSLGSRLMFDTLMPLYNRNGRCPSRESDVKQRILLRTDTFFMLANQLPLLALGQMKVTEKPPADECARDYLTALVGARPTSPTLLHEKQLALPSPLRIVSFQDPEDLLGFRFTDHLALRPDDGALTIVQVLHRNTAVRGLFGAGLGSNPAGAHAVELERDSAARLIVCGAHVGHKRRLAPASSCL